MKKYILVLILGLFFYGSFIWMLIMAHRHKIEPSSNISIVKYYEGVFKDSDSGFLNQVAEAYIETKYEGILKYNCFSPGSSTHTLYDYNTGIDLSDSFPKIREFIKKKYPQARDSWYDYSYQNGIVFIYLAHASLYNQKKTIIWLIYAPDSKKLKSRFSGYKLYPKDSIPIEPYNWLYKIDKNWYICSPDDWIGY